MKLFLDIDGVLLQDRLWPPQLADGIEVFLQFVTQNFDCYWLTTHCNGDAQTAVDYLMRVAKSDKTLELLKPFKATEFDVFKTEALPKSRDFYWIDDAPLAGELQFLEDNNLLNCWLHVNVNHNSDSLLECLAFLKKHKSGLGV